MSTRETHHLDQYADWMRSWGASSSTITQRLKAARRAAERWPEPGNVLPSDVAAWLASDQFSPWTRLTYHNHLHALFAWLAAEGHIEVDPTARLRRPTTPKRKPRPLDPEEVALALSGTAGNLHAWLTLGFYAGLRAHETAKLHGSDVTESSLFVRGKGGKDAVLPTHPAVWELAQARPRDGFWFPYPFPARAHIDVSTVTKAVGRHFRRLGIEGSYHRARHTYGTSLLRAGADLIVVRDLMRHDSVKTTEAYLGIEDQARRDAILLLSA